MEINFNTDAFMQYIQEKGGEAALDALQTALNDAASSGSQILIEQAQLTAKYITMRNNGELSPNEFESLVEDMSAELKAEMLHMNLTAREAGQKLLLSFVEILKGALSVLVTVAL